MAAERKIVCYIAQSLDGYIATAEDSLKWLIETESEGDAGYAEFLETVDTIIMGRRTYDWVMEEEGDYPYREQQSFVFSSSRSGRDGAVRYVNEGVKEFAGKLMEEDGGDIWVVGGSELLHDFLAERLIDELIISIAPVLIGKGIPLFQELDFETRYHLKSVKQYGQFAQLHYVRK